MNFKLAVIERLWEIEPAVRLLPEADRSKRQRRSDEVSDLELAIAAICRHAFDLLHKRIHVAGLHVELRQPRTESRARECSDRRLAHMTANCRVSLWRI